MHGFDREDEAKRRQRYALLRNVAQRYTRSESAVGAAAFHAPTNVMTGWP